MRGGVIVLGAAFAALVLAGCDLVPGEFHGDGRDAMSSAAESPTTSPSAPAPSPSPAQELTFRDELGRAFSALGPSEPRVTGRGSTLTVRVRLSEPDDVLELVAPDGATWQREPDRSALLRETNGEPGNVGGLGVPAASDANGARVPVEVEAASRTIRIGARPRSATVFPVHLDVTLAARALDDLNWAEELEGGRSLQVFPAPWGRTGAQAATKAVWESIIELEPKADTPVMDKQLRCHALGARDKESWNLEPWRPDLPYLEYLVARCNPT